MPIRRLFAAAVLLITSLSAHAASDATSAFSTLVANTQATGPGYYTSAERNTFVGGSYRVYVPQDTIHLIDVSPPTFSAGCGGVNIYFGGLSFINSQQIQQLISELPQMLYGLALAAIRTLCPICSDVLSAIQKLAQEASKAALDACHLATLAMNTAEKSLGFQDNATAQCNAWASLWGDASDPTAASTGQCSSMTNAVTELNSKINSLLSSGNTDGASQQAAQLCGSIGNREWCALTISGIDNTYVKEVLISMMGAHLSSPNCNTATSTSGGSGGSGSGGGSSGATTSAAGECDYQGWSSVEGMKDKDTASTAARELMDVILFGTDPSASASAIQSAAGTAGATFASGTIQEIQWAENQNLGNLPFLLCNAVDAGGNQYTPPASTPAKGNAYGITYLHFCDAVTMKSLSTVTTSDNPLITQTGLIVFVEETLQQAVQAVAQGNAIPQQALQLMQIIPLPVYKMVNIAAVYPDVAAQLIQNYSVFIGYMVAQEVVSNWINDKTSPTGGMSSDTPTVNLSAEMSKVTASVSASAVSIGKDVGNTLTLQLQVLSNIQSINDAIYQTMAMNGIMGNLLFTQNLATGLVAGHS